MVFLLKHGFNVPVCSWQPHRQHCIPCVDQNDVCVLACMETSGAKCALMWLVRQEVWLYVRTCVCVMCLCVIVSFTDFPLKIIFSFLCWFRAPISLNLNKFSYFIDLFQCKYSFNDFPFSIAVIDSLFDLRNVCTIGLFSALGLLLYNCVFGNILNSTKHQLRVSATWLIVPFLPGSAFSSFTSPNQ